MPISPLFRWRGRPDTGVLSRVTARVLAVAISLVLIAGVAGAASGTSKADAGLTWSLLSPPASPPGLFGAVAAYDSADSTVVLFGGRLADGQLSDRTWVWNGSNWSDPTLYGSSPAARQLASMAFDPDLDPPQLVLFGGRGSDGALLDDTWTWNGSSWNQVPTSTSPGGREGAAMATDADHHLVLFGGYGVSATVPTTGTTTTTTTAPSTTTTAPSTTTTTTVPVTTTTSTPSADGAASAASPVATPGTVAAATTGAISRSSTAVTVPEVLDDTWALSQTDNGADAWQRVSTRIHPPPTTDAALAAGPSGETVLFGGTSREPGDDQNGGASAQVWVWTGHVWSHPDTRRGPSARQDATFVFDADLDATVLYGGLGTGGTVGDTWLWEGRSWQSVTPATAPSARTGAAGAYDPGSRQLLIFGGIRAGGATLSSTEVLSTRAPTKVTTTPTTIPTSGGSGSSSTTGATTRGTRTGNPSHLTSPSGSSSPSEPTSPVVRPTIVEHRGDIVTLTGSGFLPHAQITITFHSTAVNVGTTTANATGSFRVTVAVPMQAAIGDHHFEASGMGPDGLTDLLTPIRVVGLGGGHHTSETTKVTLIGIALAIPALSWATLDVLGRRRRRAAPA